MGLAGWANVLVPPPLGFVGVKAELLPLRFVFELDVLFELLNDWVLEEPGADVVMILLLSNEAELNDKRSLPKLLRNPVAGPAAFEEHDENNPPTIEGPAPVEPDKTFGAEVFRPNIGVGSAGLIKRSLARRF